MTDSLSGAVSLSAAVFAAVLVASLMTTEAQVVSVNVCGGGRGGGCVGALVLLKTPAGCTSPSLCLPAGALLSLIPHTPSPLHTPPHLHTSSHLQFSQVLFSPDGAWLYSAGVDGGLCVYDVVQVYNPVKFLPAGGKGIKVCGC